MSFASADMIKLLENPKPEDIADSVDQFLHQLAGPTCIVLDGEDNSRCRAVTTLLHGNEPSGLIAVHRLLKEGVTPRTRLVIFIASVKAALTAPQFSHRALPGFRDLNRCFREPFHDSLGLLAKGWIQMLTEYRPEALLDIHNTSGTGPAFAVAISEDEKHLALATLFTRRLIVTDLRLGALMELSENVVPTVTIECGGAQDEESHLLAYEGLGQYLQAENLYQSEGGFAVELLFHPVRLEVANEAVVSCADSIREGIDICLLPDIEHYNFGQIDVDQPLAWLTEHGWSQLSAPRTDGSDVLERLFRFEQGALYAARPLKLFMVTTNTEIAKSDCILYAVEA